MEEKARAQETGTGNPVTLSRCHPVTLSPLPALLGGPPVCPAGPPDWPLPDEEIRAALLSAWHSGAWGKYRGGMVHDLERRLREVFRTPHVATCGSGTYAVELALRALKVGPGDEVILSAYDYPGNFLSVHAVGALPVLVDVHPDNWNLDPQRLAEAFSPRTRAVLVSHLHGGLVPMPEVLSLASARRVPVIEDAAQAPGAWLHERPAGSWGDVGILSFGGSKLLTAGRGGAFLTHHADIDQRARLLLTRGGNRVCPLSELQAAVLLPQLEQLEAHNNQRSEAVRSLDTLLQGVPGLRRFRNAENSALRPVFYKVGFQYDAAEPRLPRQRFIAAVHAEGIALDAGFDALHVGRSPGRYRAAGPLTEVERAHAGTVVLHHPVLRGTPEQLEQVAEAVRKVLAFDWPGTVV